MCDDQWRAGEYLKDIFFVIYPTVALLRLTLMPSISVSSISSVQCSASQPSPAHRALTVRILVYLCMVGTKKAASTHGSSSSASIGPGNEYWTLRLAASWSSCLSVTVGSSYLTLSTSMGGRSSSMSLASDPSSSSSVLLSAFVRASSAHSLQVARIATQT